MKSTRTHPDCLFFTDYEDLHSVQLFKVSWAGISLSVFLFSPTAHLPWQKQALEHKGSPHLPIEDYLSHQHSEIVRWSILFVINKTYCTLADLLCYQGSVRVKFLRRQWQRMKGDLSGDASQITWESKERSTLLTKNIHTSENAHYLNCRYSLLTSSTVGKVNLLMHGGMTKTWETWKAAREK